MFKVWNGLFFLLFACNTQASDDVDVRNSQIFKQCTLFIIAERELMRLRNDLVMELNKDEFKKIKNSQSLVSYLNNLRHKIVLQYYADPVFRVCSLLDFEGYDSQDPQEALSCLFWVKNSINIQRCYCDKYIRYHRNILLVEDEREISNRLQRIPIERSENFYRCLGADITEHLLTT